MSDRCRLALNRSVNRTCIGACSAVDAGICVDDVLSIAFADRFNRTLSYVCPTFHPCLQLAPRGVAIHTREFAELVKTDAAHECLVKGAELIALQIAKIFSDEGRIAAMKRDFETA